MPDPNDDCLNMDVADGRLQEAMDATLAPKKRGRPPGHKFTTPVRSIRISDDEWQKIQDASDALEVRSVDFIRSTLVREADRVLEGK